MDLCDVTIVVPTRNERINVRTFLAGIPPDIDLVVVDDSDDDTRDIVREVRRQRTRIIRTRGTIAAARQIGADAAATDWVLFTDADVVFAPDYFTRLAELPVPVGQGGFVGAKSSVGRYRRYYWWFDLWLRIACLVGAPAGTGSNMLLRRSALADAGGFDVSQRCNEDSLVTYQVKRAGHRVTFAPRLVVHEVDHRRLERGAWKKSLHSIVRCMALFWGLIPASRRSHDWGYWEPRPDATAAHRPQPATQEEPGGAG